MPATMLKVPRWPMQAHASWSLPLLTLTVVYALAPHLSEFGRALLIGVGLFDMTISAALFAWLFTPKAERHPEQGVLVAVRGLCIAALVLPEVRAWVWGPWLAACAVLGLVLYGLSRPLPQGYAELDDLERRVAFLGRIFPRSEVGRFLAFESLVWANVFGKPRLPGEQTFTSQSGVNARMFLTMLCFLIVMESIPVHFLLAEKFPVVAKIHLLLNVLTILWLTGQIRALSVRRTSVSHRRLYLRSGLNWTGSVPLSNVQSAAPLTGEKPTGALNIASDIKPNILLTFRTPVTMLGMSGTSKTTEQVALHVDDVKGFLAALPGP